MPGATHQHVSHENQVAAEMEEQPFSAGLDTLDRSSGDRALVICCGEGSRGGLKETTRLP